MKGLKVAGLVIGTVVVAGLFIAAQRTFHVPWWLELSVLAGVLLLEFVLVGFIQEATGRSVRDVARIWMRGSRAIPNVSVVLQCETTVHHGQRIVAVLERVLDTKISGSFRGYAGSFSADRTYHVEVLGESLNQTELEEFSEEDATYPREFHIHLRCENTLIRDIPPVLQQLSQFGQQTSEALQELGALRCRASSYLLKVPGWAAPLDIHDIPGKPFPTRVRRTETELQLFGALSNRALKEVKALIALHVVD